MDTPELEKIEIDLLIESINRRYGLDFSHYSRASFSRRVRHFVAERNLGSISHIIPALLHTPDFLRSFLNSISITVTEMFRDPVVFRSIRDQVVPFLKTYPSLKIWHAGCATGEEVYSLSILFHEEGLLDRCQIYATDFNDNALVTAKAGVYSADRLKEFNLNYKKSGGKHFLADYFYSESDFVIIDKQFKQNIVYANHNLISDGSFGEMHLIFCRNVLIYFDKHLQKNVFALFLDSLMQRGFLCLGTKENFPAAEIAAQFEVVSPKDKIYMKA